MLISENRPLLIQTWPIHGSDAPKHLTKNIYKFLYRWINSIFLYISLKKIYVIHFIYSIKKYRYLYNANANPQFDIKVYNINHCIPVFKKLFCKFIIIKNIQFDHISIYKKVTREHLFHLCKQHISIRSDVLKSCYTYIINQYI